MTPELHFTLKVASRCNLDCAYCYVYNKGDDSWRDRPALMPEEVFEAAVERIRRHCEASKQTRLVVLFHGGEPLLVGPRRFSRCCERLRSALEGVVEATIVVQTNGVLIDARWTEVFIRHSVSVGVSIDGPRHLHDAYRVDHRGRGSYDCVTVGVRHLLEAELPVSFLSVIPFGADPLMVHRHLLELGASSIDYLFPDYTHDAIAAVRRRFGPTPCSDFLIPIFDEWWFNGTLEVTVNPFLAIARAILGGESRVDFIGNRPFGFVFVETDGAIEGLDVLRVCGQGVAATGLNVAGNDFAAISDANGLHRAAIFDGMPLPSVCRTCPEATTCAGGYLPHRYSRARGFDNPSVWCRDLLALFAHIRKRLGVPVEETALRRQVLAEMAAESVAAAH
jgi:uncharacterized protein